MCQVWEIIPMSTHSLFCYELQVKGNERYNFCTSKGNDSDYSLESRTFSTIAEVEEETKITLEVSEIFFFIFIQKQFIKRVRFDSSVKLKLFS